MTPIAETLLNLPAREVIGTTVKFRSPKTLRVRTGHVVSISAGGVRVAAPHRAEFFLAWSDLLETTERVRAPRMCRLASL
jgi:hypothetical protein